MAAQQDITVAEAERLLAALSGANAAGRAITDLRFGPPVQPARGARWRPADAHGVAFRDLEWTHGSILGRLFARGRVQECSFEKVNLDDFDAKNVDFLDCQFDRVTFGQHFLGLIKDCAFTRCSFAKCRFDAVGFVGSTVRSCRFDGPTGTDRARWEDCTLEDVTFSGTLDGVRFIRSVFHNVDMSAAKMHEVSILDTREGEAKLPDRPENYAIHVGLFLDAVAALRSRLDPAAGEAYSGLAKSLARSGSPFIVDAPLMDVLLGELPPGARPVVMTTLYELRRSRPLWAPAVSVSR